jgi:hypothetical protein
VFPDAADHHEDFLSVKEEILAVVEKINEDACNDCAVTGLREATLEFASGMPLESRRIFAQAMKKDLQELALPDRNKLLAADLYAYVQYRTERLGHVYTGADEQWFS